MRIHPHLFELNLRSFLRGLGDGFTKESIEKIPEEYWLELQVLGINIIWLMGVWRTCPGIIEECCFDEGLIQSYNRALKDWVKEDVAGSPYSICDYEFNTEICKTDELIRLRQKLNSLGMKLILDFIPNHFSAGSELIGRNPEFFLEVDEETFIRDQHTFFRPSSFTDRYFAHGRDPFFPGWTDTIQVNYFNPSARAFMIDRLKNIAGYCDGVRCDMAMLCLNNVFHNTWRGVINEKLFTKPDKEFWSEAISEVKKDYPGFVFIAESYWDLEWDLQQLGFDYTYDKKLLDRLKDGTPRSIRDHLKADADYQRKSVRFIENHDEERSVISLGREKVLPAALLMSTIPGMKLFFEGQFSGKKTKLPVQLIREPKENVVSFIREGYHKILKIANRQIFHDGMFTVLEALPAWHNNDTYPNIIAYQWILDGERAVVCVNYSGSAAQCRLKINVDGCEENIEMNDLMNNKLYIRSSEEILRQGLYVELGGYQSHVFLY